MAGVSRVFTVPLLAVLVFAVYHVDASVKWKKNMKSFSHSMKQGHCHPDKEVQLFEHKNGPGVVTEQWYTGFECFNEHSRILIYIDGEKEPSIDMNLYLGHGIGFVKKPEKQQNSKNPAKNAPWMTKDEDPGVPWGRRRIGHVASGGGLYNTYRIPFQKSIKISLIAKTKSVYWFIVRGVENYPVIIGDVELPSSARLKLYTMEKVTMKPLDYAVLASSDKKSGMLYQVTLATNSSNFVSQEACFRAVIDNEKNIQYLSSGTEDLFLSAFYYDQGIYHTDQAGVTYMEYPGTVSAYKFFEDDPVFFTSSFKLLWRCGEIVDNECFSAKQRKCHTKNMITHCDTEEDKDEFNILDHLNKKLKDTDVSAYAWVYEWDPEEA